MLFNKHLTPKIKNLLETPLDKMEAAALKTLVWTLPIKDIILNANWSTTATKQACEKLQIETPPNNFWSAVKLGVIPHPNGVVSHDTVPELKELRFFKERTEMFGHTEWFPKIKKVAHLPWNAMTRAQILEVANIIPANRLSAFLNALPATIEKKHKGINLRVAL